MGDYPQFVHKAVKFPVSSKVSAELIFCKLTHTYLKFDDSRALHYL